VDPSLTMKDLAVSLVTTRAGLEAVREEWQRLVDAAEGATVFQSWEWAVSWYAHFGHERLLRIFTVRDHDGRLIGLAPCSLSESRWGGFRLLHLLGRGNDLTEYVQILARPGYEQTIASCLFGAWHRASDEWDLLVLPAMPGDGPILSEIRRLAAARGYGRFVYQHVGMTRPLPPSWDLFYRSLRKSMKDNVNNYLNRLRRAGHKEEMVVVEDPAALDDALETFLDLHQRRASADLGRRHENRFATKAHRDFLMAVGRRLFARGALWPCFLKIDGQIVASQLCLVYKDRLHLYYSGFDPEWARHGVMMVLTRRCIERAIERGYRKLDLLLGLDQDKIRWGAEPQPVLNLALANPRLRSRAALAVYRLRRAVDAWTWRRTRRGTPPTVPDGTVQADPQLPPQGTQLLPPGRGESPPRRPLTPHCG
jgi:CelD/BcsL family acetyltransferase involved in cellulose biosynthesis